MNGLTATGRRRRLDLVRGDAAVGFGHLGAKYDHAHGEG